MPFCEKSPFYGLSRTEAKIFCRKTHRTAAERTAGVRKNVSADIV